VPTLHLIDLGAYQVPAGSVMCKWI